MSTMGPEQILAGLRAATAPVVICGAGIVGEVLLRLCRAEGVAIAAFCDNSEKVANRPFCGLEVIHTPQLLRRFPRVVVLVSVAAIKDAVDLLEDLGVDEWYAGGVLLRDFDVSQGPGGAQIDYSKFAVENCILCHDGYLQPEKLFLRSVDLIITERCSLRCRDCSNLMQYYQSPRNCVLPMLQRSLDALFAVADEIMDVRIIGGDAFMNRDWTALVTRLSREPRARRIVLYTNGTILPPPADLRVLQQEKVLVVITDYGPLSRQMAPLRAALETLGIAYHVLEVDAWLDCAAIAQHFRSEDAQRALFKNCCAKNMLTLSDGKLFRCPYAANAYRLQAVPDSPQDYVDLFATPLSEEESRVSMKNVVRNYLLHLNYLQTCDFCNGRPLAGVEVAPAVQTDKPLPYRKYPH